MFKFDFNSRPFIVIWEMTRACSLVCRHCRASAKVKAHPFELTTEESYRLIDQVARCQPVIFIMTGGDPIRRQDLEPLITYAAREKQLRLGLAPSATPEFAAADLTQLKAWGVDRISLSLDGADRESHDKFRGVPGTYDLTMRIVEKAREAELPIQINTTFTKQNIDTFDAFVNRLQEINPVLWSVFQLVPTGRGKNTDLLSGEQMEQLFNRLFELSLTAPFDIKTTEGHHYRRVVVQRSHGIEGMEHRAPLGISDGKGFVFVSHIGEICPSGFLPLAAGNVRKDELIEVYRHSKLFQDLRSPHLFEGKCGYCEFNQICGGSRSRAYAMTGDYMGHEPLCIYQPAAHPKPQPVLS